MFEVNDIVWTILAPNNNSYNLEFQEPIQVLIISDKQLSMIWERRNNGFWYSNKPEHIIDIIPGHIFINKEDCYSAYCYLYIKPNIYELTQELNDLQNLLIKYQIS